MIIEKFLILLDNIKPQNFIDESIDKNYPQKDYHQIYFGEIVNIIGCEKYFTE